jgi:hypothetical protein
MRFHLQIDDGEPSTQPTPGAASTDASGGQAPPDPGSGAPPQAPDAVIDAGPPPAELLDALGDTRQVGEAFTEAFDGGTALADHG